LLALALMAGAIGATWLVLTGAIHGKEVSAFAEFQVCGQGLRTNGDVKERGVLVGSIGDIEVRQTDQGNVCRVEMKLQPDAISQIPENVGAQIRAKTLFGEKWLELLYPEDPSDENIAAGQVITMDETIDPLEVETILNTGLPVLEAIDPERLSGALTALTEGFIGHEDEVIQGIVRGNDALAPLNRRRALLEKGIRQLAQSGDILDRVSPDLLTAMGNLNRLNAFTIDNRALIAENLRKAPELLREVSDLFVSQFGNLTKIVDRGATVIGLLAARTDDLDRLLNALPVFNSRWIRNLNHQCRFRQQTTEPGASAGDPVPGRCWRVHNLVVSSRGAYEPGEEPRPRKKKKKDGNVDAADYESIGLLDPSALDRLMYAPALSGGMRLPELEVKT
jgi:phospholipid/cholesterol/gamma-HCH transport system substrate-binding protein